MAALALAVALEPASALTGAVPSDVQQYLIGVAKFSAAEAASLETGRVIAKVTPGGVEGEVVVVAAVKIQAARKQVVAYYGQMVSYVDGEVTKGFGRFSNPPVLADVQRMTLDAADIAHLKSCRPSDCDLRVGGAAVTKVRAAVDWNGPDPAGQVNTLLRQSAVDYVAAYLKTGDEALITYDSSAKPVSLKQQWQGLMQGSQYFQQTNPALRDYLSQYPRQKLAGATDILYWVNEVYTGLKPVISIVHAVVYDAPGQPDRTVIMQKQLYASHYYDGSLALAVAIDATGRRRSCDLFHLRQPLARRPAEGRLRRPQAQAGRRSGAQSRRANARHHQASAGTTGSLTGC